MTKIFLLTLRFKIFAFRSLVITTAGALVDVFPECFLGHGLKGKVSCFRTYVSYPSEFFVSVGESAMSA